MQDPFEFIICTPIVPIYPVEERYLVEYVDKGINDILTLNEKLEIEISGIGVFKINVLTLPDDPSINETFPFSSHVLIFRLLVPNEAAKIEISDSHDQPTSLEDRLALFKKQIAEEFKYQVFHLLVLSNIASPGAIKTREGLILLNRKKYDSFPSIYSIHRESLDHIKALKWPTYNTLPILRIWDWFKINNFSFHYHSKTKVSRALNAFTYLFNDDPGNLIFDLFWSLIGIEALYCTSKEGISEQIYEKVQLVLGPVLESKKKIKNMYSFRSRLIHGDLDIPPNNFDYDDPDEEKFQKGLFNATILAAAILTVTLQEMVLQNRSDLNFTYGLD